MVSNLKASYRRVTSRSKAVAGATQNKSEFLPSAERNAARQIYERRIQWLARRTPNQGEKRRGRARQRKISREKFLDRARGRRSRMHAGRQDKVFINWSTKKKSIHLMSLKGKFLAPVLGNSQKWNKSARGRGTRKQAAAKTLRRFDTCCPTGKVPSTFLRRETTHSTKAHLQTQIQHKRSDKF